MRAEQRRRWQQQQQQQRRHLHVQFHDMTWLPLAKTRRLPSLTMPQPTDALLQRT
jgi:hypothetical protein